MNPKVKKYLNEETISDEELNLIMQINKIRIENKITQQELAKRTGISQPNIARFEKNTHSASLRTTIKILASLGYKLKIEKIKTP